MRNDYLPIPVEISKVRFETADRLIKTFDLTFLNPEDEERFQYIPGQFGELSLLGKGESPIGIASSPTEKGFLRFTVMKVGVVTTALHNMWEGDYMGVRGPLGNWYPIEELKGKNVVIVGGGFAFTTLRSLTVYMIDERHRGNFENITVVYGARAPGLLCYRDELEQWEKRSDLDLHVTVDAGDDSWKGLVGFVPTITEQVAPSSENAIAIVCGPPIMIKFTLPVLQKLGFGNERIVTSLENRMKCGIGKCGRCNIGSQYVCKEGPVFTMAQLENMPKEY